MPVGNVFEELINFPSPCWQSIATHVSDADDDADGDVIKQYETTTFFLRREEGGLFTLVLWSGEVDSNEEKITSANKKMKKSK